MKAWLLDSKTVISGLNIMSEIDHGIESRIYSNRFSDEIIKIFRLFLLAYKKRFHLTLEEMEELENFSNHIEAMCESLSKINDQDKLLIPPKDIVIMKNCAVGYVQPKVFFEDTLLDVLKYDKKLFIKYFIDLIRQRQLLFENGIVQTDNNFLNSIISFGKLYEIDFGAFTRTEAEVGTSTYYLLYKMMCSTLLVSVLPYIEDLLKQYYIDDLLKAKCKYPEFIKTTNSNVGFLRIIGINDEEISRICNEDIDLELIMKALELTLASLPTEEEKPMLNQGRK